MSRVSIYIFEKWDHPTYTYLHVKIMQNEHWNKNSRETGDRLYTSDSEFLNEQFWMESMKQKAEINRVFTEMLVTTAGIKGAIFYSSTKKT